MLKIITGPPGSGKTTYAEQHRQPGDVVYDMDAIAATMAQQDGYPYPRDLQALFISMRQIVLTWTRKVDRDTYIIITHEDTAKQYAKQYRGDVIKCDHGVVK